MSDSITLGAAGCYTISLTITVTDDDTGSVSTTPATASVSDAYAVRFLAPIKDNERNIAKYGNVVPVKVQLASMCAPGTYDTTRSLFVSYQKGVVGETIVGDEVLATSVSAADTGTQMRVADGFYIYNFTTKGLTQGADYTILIRLDTAGTGTIVQRAVLRANK